MQTKPKKESLFLRIPPQLNKSLNRAAELSKLSLNQYCTLVLNRVVGQSLDLGLDGFSDLVSNAKRLFPSNLEAVVAFGSWARGDNTTESDLDVLVVLDSETEINRGLYSKWDQEAIALPENLSIHFSKIPTDSLAGLWCEIANDGIVIYDKRLLVSRFLVNLRERTLDGTYQAKYSHGHRYWIEKTLNEKQTVS